MLLVKMTILHFYLYLDTFYISTLAVRFIESRQTSLIARFARTSCEGKKLQPARLVFIEVMVVFNLITRLKFNYFKQVSFAVSISGRNN